MTEEVAVKVEVNAGDEEKPVDVKAEVKTEPVAEESVKIEEEKTETKDAEMAVDETGEPDELQRKIIRQVEYYFSDYSLPRDKFLKEQIELDDGWIPLTTMVKFKRLADLTTNHKAIVTALKKSALKLMEVSEDDAKIRRSKDRPLPEDNEAYKQEVKTKTVYCKGFPRDTTNIDKVLEFFSVYPGVENVKMRYFPNKEEKSQFKGSVTATFSNKELAEKFMTIDEVKYNDHLLLRQWFVDWEKEKDEQHSKKKEKKATSDNKDGKNGEAKENEKIKLAKNAVLKLVDLPEKVDRDDIKKAFASYPADIAHVETTDNVAFVRLRGEDDGKTVLSKLEDGKITVNDTTVSVTLLEGEEEEEYLKKVLERISSSSGKSFRGRSGGRGRGRGRGRGGWRGGNKRSGSPGGDRGGKRSRKND
nr:EOG090X0CQA [Sida crystallina]